MYDYIVKGGNKLEGEVCISGSKNATLPILAATILSGKKTKLYNVPNIEDVRITIKILEHLGCKIKKEKKDRKENENRTAFIHEKIIEQVFQKWAA